MPDGSTAWIARGMPMLCANPDKVVERGDKIVWCAGALADKYASLGGKTVVVGKPHPPIYDTAIAASRRSPAGPSTCGSARHRRRSARPIFAAPTTQGSTCSSSPAASTPSGSGARHEPDGTAVAALPRRASSRRAGLYAAPRLVSGRWRLALTARRARRQGRGPSEPDGFLRECPSRPAPGP